MEVDLMGKRGNNKKNMEQLVSTLPAVSGGDSFYCLSDGLLEARPENFDSINESSEVLIDDSERGLKELSAGIVISYINSNHSKAITFGGRSTGNIIAIRLMFKGALNQIYDDQCIAGVKAPLCSFQLVKPGEMFTVSYGGEPEMELIAMYISIERLMDLLAARIDQLPGRIQAFRDSTLPHDHGHFVASDKTISIAHDLLMNISQNLFSDILVQSKGLELLYLLFEDWFNSEKPEATPKNRFRLSDQDIDSIESLYRHVCDSFCQPQTIDELAKTANINRNKLHYGFKLLYGTTVNQLQTKLRMNWAREQISLGKLSVSEISDKLNYLEVNSFSAAYRRYFGSAPTKDR
ncbi:helix-turn-helix transcriptional regulator [Pseudomaricurvus alkylphenolicus]|uniref:helix-turn-helix domain-containing protein n=1 Tax=Pseudomaricurvus alkylphenolicus TaxID=1306991 RepID=UPI00141E57AD|nr:AraC family transcriptional regulator [Pseudomaricurvus alkylphenolicus]NIB42448.1 helix-turn-helix transcriptional regulator [Pseudomaricurvus alkylphenolicus]